MDRREYKIIWANCMAIRPDLNLSWLERGLLKNLAYLEDTQPDLHNIYSSLGSGVSRRDMAAAITRLATVGLVTFPKPNTYQLEVDWRDWEVAQQYTADEVIPHIGYENWTQLPHLASYPSPNHSPTLPPTDEEKRCFEKWIEGVAEEHSLNFHEAMILSQLAFLVWVDSLVQEYNVSDVAELFGLSEETVVYSLSKLLTLDLIGIERSDGYPDNYFFNKYNKQIKLPRRK